MAEHKGTDVMIVHSLTERLRLEDDRLKSQQVNWLALYLSLGAVLLGGVVAAHYMSNSPWRKTVSFALLTHRSSFSIRST